MLVHGTCVCIGEVGVLLLGPSGSGKSDLALRLIDGGAHLVADDQVQIEAASGALLASPRPACRGCWKCAASAWCAYLWPRACCLRLASISTRMG